ATFARICAAAATTTIKFETRNPKSEKIQNCKFKCPKRLKLCLRFRILDLFRISSFGFRISCCGTKNRSTEKKSLLFAALLLVILPFDKLLHAWILIRPCPLQVGQVQSVLVDRELEAEQVAFSRTVVGPLLDHLSDAAEQYAVLCHGAICIRFN